VLNYDFSITGLRAGPNHNWAGAFRAGPARKTARRAVPGPLARHVGLCRPGSAGPWAWSCCDYLGRARHGPGPCRAGRPVCSSIARFTHVQRHACDLSIKEKRHACILVLFRIDNWLLPSSAALSHHRSHPISSSKTNRKQQQPINP
jgi:hypothetical protein